MGAEKPRDEPVDLSGDGLTRYLRSWNPRLLTPQQERDAARRRDQGDPDGIDTLIRHNLRLVYSIARRYTVTANAQGIPLDDLIQEGTLGLLRAAEKYDPDKGFRFTTYAVWWIRQSIQRLYGFDRTIRVPTHVWEYARKARNAQTKLEARHGQQPTAEEVRAEAHLPASVDIDQLLRIHERTGSLDYEADDNFETLDARVTRLVDDRLPEDDLFAKERDAELAGWLDELPPRERLVLEHRFGLNGRPELTLEQIGAELGVTRERIRQMQNRAIKRLRLQLGQAA